MTDAVTTEYINALDPAQRSRAISRAAELMKNGGLAAIPTETVYGLAANAFDGEAVRHIFEVKGRPQDNPIISHISDLDMWPLCSQGITEDAMALARRFWPGPLTIILKKGERISDVVTCGMETAAVRMPSHPIAREIIRAAGVPLAAPSANLSGLPSPTTAEHCMRDLNGKVPLVVDGGPCDVGVESTVVSLVGPGAVILRPGIISLDDIRTVLPDATLSDAIMRDPKPGERVMSPGMKYRHYSPKADVVVLRGSLEKYTEYVAARYGDGVWALVFDGEQVPFRKLEYGAEGDSAAQAHGLFSALRRMDDLGARRVFARCPSEKGAGLAVCNRLFRAAGFNIINLDS